MALIEVNDGQRSLAFELTTGIQSTPDNSNPR